MTLASPSPANHWFEPAADTDTLPSGITVVADSGDYTLASTALPDAGIEDDGTGDFTLYVVASLPGVNTQLSLSQISSGDVFAFEVAP